MEKTGYPKKLFYKIGEVATITGLEPYVLRYWEGEFNLKLSKSKNNQRLYQQKDIDQILRVKTLLYDEKYTIAGAKKKLRSRKGEKQNESKNQMKLSLPDPDVKRKKEALESIRKELKEMLVLIDTPRRPSANA